MLTSRTFSCDAVDELSVWIVKSLARADLFVRFVVKVLSPALSSPLQCFECMTDADVRLQTWAMSGFWEGG
jgi:hypothetical protein